MPPISAVIIALDEEARVAEAVRSASWAEEVLVVDGGSRDASADEARRAGARVIVNPWPGFSEQRNFAAARAANDWLFFLDADERVSAELRDSVRALGGGTGSPAGYEVARRPIFYGRALRFGGYYPGYRVRLYDRRRGRWSARRVHERVVLEGAAGRLRGDLLHWTGHGLEADYRRILSFSALAARDALERRRARGLLPLLVRPPAAFLWRYVLRLGFLDGVPGLIAASQSSVYSFLKHARAWEAVERGRRQEAS